MKTHLGATILAEALAAWLAHSGVVAAYDRQADYRLPLVTIPVVAVAPVIDGHVSEGEWDSAAVIGGFINIGAVKDSGYLAADEIEARVAYDAERLYVLYVTRVKESPSAPATGASDEYHRDLDMIELWIAPRGEGGAFFQFIGAPNGAKYDTRMNEPRWNGMWEFKNSVGGGRWIAEVGVAFRDLGLEPPKRGEEWRMNFCRTFTQEGRATAWSDTLTRYAVPRRFGRVRFGDVAAQIAVDTSPMPLGNLAWRCGAANLSQTPALVELNIQSRLKPVFQVDGQAGDGLTTAATGNVFLESRVFKLTPGERREQRIQDSYQSRDARCYSISMLQQPSRTPVFEQLIPISPQAGQALHVVSAALYETKQFLVEIEAGPLRAQGHGDAQVRITVRRSGVPVATRDIPLSRDRLEVALAPQKWQPGGHEVEVQAWKGQETLAKAATALQVEPEPEWWGNALGAADRLQPPWTAVRMDGPVISVWGREYRLGAGGLPEQVVTQGVSVLAAPITFRLGEDSPRLSEATLTTQVVKDTRALLSMKGSLGLYELTGTVEATYDGVVEYDCTFQPKNDSAANPGLWLEIPLRREVARWLVRRASGQGLIKGVSFRVENDLVLPFNHSLWLGDIEHGLSWYTDTDEGWTAPRQVGVELKARPDMALVRVHILGPGPCRPLRLRFGLLATPVRPLPRHWRRLRFAAMRASGSQPWAAANVHTYETGKAFLYGRSPLETTANGQHLVPERDRRWLDEQIPWSRRLKAKFVLYSPAHGTIAKSYAYQTYHTEWDMLPLQSLDPGRLTHFFYVCPRSRHGEYFVWNLDRMLNADRLDGVYFDQAASDVCRNARHGCGWDDGHGRRTTQTIRPQRDFYRRVRQLFLDHGKEPLLVGHTSNMVVPANYTHLDLLYNGEQFTANLTDNDYIAAIDEDMLLTQWSSKLMGVPVVFLPEILWRDMKEKGWTAQELYEKWLLSEPALKATRKLMALLLPNDILFGGGLLHVEFGKRIWAIWDTLGDATHHSHRQPGLTTQPAPPRIQAGLYVKPEGEALLVVGNLVEPRTVVKVTIAPQILPLNGAQAEDILDGQPCRLEGQTVALDVDGRNFRLVRLTKRD